MKEIISELKEQPAVYAIAGLLSVIAVLAALLYAKSQPPETYAECARDYIAEFGDEVCRERYDSAIDQQYDLHERDGRY